mmetsp:Transcript_122504/g.183182  ORF Transcript_122504/g.183182 Transcript_122504/m.183182 type:complete len:397 (+) Transcript_122504:2-1192(+)
MSHRKFSAPRHGHMGFLPRKRTKHHRGKIKHFPKDDASKDTHLTAFMGYKAGMTHIVRFIERPGSVYHKKDMVEAVTILDCPPMAVVGVVGYVETPRGLRSLSTVWSGDLSDDVKRRFYKNWYRSKKKAFTKYAAKYADEASKKADIDGELDRIRTYCTVVRAICHTQTSLLHMRLKKGHVFEVQVNGGSVSDKVKFATDLFEKPVNVSDVFETGDFCDVISSTKGHGFEGVVTRWGVKRLPRKSHRGLRKVACIGAWHPARVGYYVARAGQRGYHHRTERNKRILRIGLKPKEGEVDSSASTESDITLKGITPVGGFPQYGAIENDWVMVKGGIAGARKRPITLRKPARHVARKAEPITIKFIDTASKQGHGRFQTVEEKKKFYGALKKDKADTE